MTTLEAKVQSITDSLNVLIGELRTLQREIASLTKEVEPTPSPRIGTIDEAISRLRDCP